MRHGDSHPADFQMRGAASYDYIAGKQPNGNQVFRGRGRDSEAEQRATLDMLERLALRLHIDGRRPSENDWIPAGYTYLGQLLAHDLTFNPAPLPKAPRDSDAIANLRSAALDLDCIYGGGPHTSPWLYQLEGKPGTNLPRKRLRLGLTQPASDPPRSDDDVPRNEDIPRICSDSSDNNLPDARAYTRRNEAAETSGCPAHHGKTCFYEALLADPRNEDTLILAQLVVLFGKLHNTIVDRLESGGMSPRDPSVFDIARRITLSCYQSVIVHDFLARLLSDDVWKAYKKKSKLSAFPFFGNLAKQHARIPIPLEFSHAAFRVGHFMVQSRYSLNKSTSATVSHLLTFNGEDHLVQRSNSAIPIKNDWVIAWYRFFPDLDENLNPVGRVYNKSRKIEAAVASPLYVDSRFQPDVSHRRDERDPNRKLGGLVYRDLVRAYYLGLPNGQHLARDVFKVKELSGDDIKTQLKRFNRSLTGEDNPIGGDIDDLARDTPLLHYILIEAELTQDGRRLGPLGSSIIAEVVFGALAAYDAPLNEAATGWVETIFGGDGVPTTMPKLIDFVQPENAAGQPAVAPPDQVTQPRLVVGAGA